MMPEISLNILDVAENSTRAKASLVEITVDTDVAADTLTVVIKDDGCGMTEEQVAQVIDPFYTSRTTRKVGLGVPFFKYAAESTGGSFFIRSQVGVGTVVTAVFVLSHIDRMPLGDKLIAEGKTGVKAGEGVLKYGPMDEYVEKRNRRIIQMTKIMDQWDREDQ